MFNERYAVTHRFAGTVLAANHESLVIARGGSIERCDLNFQSIEKILTWDKSWRSVARRWSPLARFMRLNIGPSSWLGDTLFVVTRQGILRIRMDLGDYELISLPTGMKGPLTLTADIGVDGVEDSLLFGNYSTNSEMAEVSICKIGQKGPIEIIARSRKGQINHVHSVIPSRDGLNYFVLSGDFGGAARIWRLPRGGSKLEPVTPPAQRFRSCWLVERDNGFIYATDRQDKENCVSSFDIKNLSNTTIAPISGASIDHLPHPHGDPGSVLFSTTVEGQNSEKMTLRHFFSIRKGPAFQSRNTVLYRFNLSTLHLEKLFAARKDWLPFVPFQFGRLTLPPQRADPAGPLFINATAVLGCRSGALRLDPVPNNT